MPLPQKWHLIKFTIYNSVNHQLLPILITPDSFSKTLDCVCEAHTQSRVLEKLSGVLFQMSSQELSTGDTPFDFSFRKRNQTMDRAEFG